MSNPSIFISYAPADGAFARSLRAELELLDMKVWEESRQLAAGDKSAFETDYAIARSDVFLVVVSGHSMQSKQVIKEVRFALQAQAESGAEQYGIIPVLLDGFAREGLANWFEEEIKEVVASSAPGGLSEAMPAILAALGLRLPEAQVPAVQPPESPVNELLLVLKNPTLYTEDGKRRGMAAAKLELHPADGSPMVESEDFEFISPLGPIEAGRLRDYLEKYPRYPFLEKILPKVAEIERQIPQWGKALLEAITPTEDAREVLRDWLATPAQEERRFSIKIDAALPKNLPEESRGAFLEAASILLSTPWEILHDDLGFLFQGQRPVRVRRMQPNRRKKEAIPLQNVLRILLVVPRPDDERAGYIDHRAATRALLQAVDHLGELVELEILETPTFPALSARIREASAAGKPFSVVHFDGHGVFDFDKGLGALCFESAEAQEQAKNEGRATAIVDTAALAAELRELRIPLFFLDACQSAMTDHDPTASVAATLLKNGVASVAAMSHSVLVTTAEKFATAFYQRLAEGGLIGSAMLAGQQALHADSVRMDLPDNEKLRLQDWFVPVLFQEEKDPQLVKKIPSRAAREVDQQLWKIRLGDMPLEPKHGFVGRDRELLRLERQLLRKDQRWAVLRGQGGAGKTTLAAEFARWMLRTRRFGRLAFVSFEYLTDARAAIDALGKQLVSKDFSVATFENEEKAMLPIDRALRDRPTLILLDNLESILPDLEGNQPPGVLAVNEFMAFFQRLLQSSDGTRLLMTTRERMPAPFDVGKYETRLGALAPEDALALIARVMRQERIPVPSMNSEDLDKQFGTLAQLANYNARALTLLTRTLAERGDDLPGLNADLSHLMIEMEEKNPGDKDNSLFASVELSLRRLPQGMREKVDALAVFHGGANLIAWATVAQCSQEEITPVATLLVEHGLAEQKCNQPPYFFQTDPALPIWLSLKIATSQLSIYYERWAEEMIRLVEFLTDSKDIYLINILRHLEEQNLLYLLNWLQENDTPEQLIFVATHIERIFWGGGHPGIISWIDNIRQKSADKLKEWSHARFVAIGTQADRLLEQGNVTDAFEMAKYLLEQCQGAMKAGYPQVEHDLARATLFLARVIRVMGQPGQALPLLNTAREIGLTLIENGIDANGPIALEALTEIGNCNMVLGKWADAAENYNTAIVEGTKRQDWLYVAANKGQLATIRHFQKRYKEALDGHSEVQNIFETLGNNMAVITSLYQKALIYKEIGEDAAAEQAYLQALDICMREKNREQEALLLDQLGLLYRSLSKLEDSVTVLLKAIEITVELKNKLIEGRSRHNLATVLIKLGRYSEARLEITRAIECIPLLEHTGELWKSLMTLHDLEMAENNLIAAAEAKRRATEDYLTYRYNGGGNLSNQADLFVAAMYAIQTGQTNELIERLEFIVEPEHPIPYKALIRQLCTLLRGSRETALADDPELDYLNAVELRILLENLKETGL